MYRSDLEQTEFADFYLPFGGKLLASNRWVKLAAMIPWGEVEACYRKSFAGTGMGAPAKSARIAFGALIIKERPGVTDEETVEQTAGNPCLQSFLGLHEYRQEALFDPSMMVHFRSRFGPEDDQRINGEIIRAATGPKEDKAAEEKPDQEPPANEGKLLVDATCTPADIPVEGKFGNLKRKGTLERIMAKLAHTSESVIHVGLIVLNLDQWLRAVLFWLGTTGLDLLPGLLRARTKALRRKETLSGREIFSRHARFTC